MKLIPIIGVRVNTISYPTAVNLIANWSYVMESRYVCIANTHMLMEAYDSPDFAEIVNGADLVTPDGMPLVWMMRLKGQRNQTRVYGPNLMLYVLAFAAQNGIPVGFLGGSPEVLELLVERMKSCFEDLIVAYAYSPSFQILDMDEDNDLVNRINGSGARILFVGLGCPKQEIWMAAHRDRVQSVMLGVGAAFDFHAGLKPQAPAWMQAMGLEWCHRLLTEPRRLWRRYLYNNPRFIFLAVLDLMGFFR